jgi:hypothetical protein
MNRRLEEYRRKEQGNEERSNEKIRKLKDKK